MLKTDECYMTTSYQETLHTNEEYVQCMRYKMCAWMNRQSTVIHWRTVIHRQRYTDNATVSHSQVRDCRAHVIGRWLGQIWRSVICELFLTKEAAFCTSLSASCMSLARECTSCSLGRIDAPTVARCPCSDLCMMFSFSLCWLLIIIMALPRWIAIAICCFSKVLISVGDWRSLMNHSLSVVC